MELLMRHAMFNQPENRKGAAPSSRQWALLPGLCCQAAGGKRYWADGLASAWMLFYCAAHLMDSVEDQDIPEAWWQNLGPGGAINVASGLFFTAACLLSETKFNREAAEELQRSFYRGMIQMCAGQHLDLITHQPSLEDYWRIAAEKSGSFFGIACYCGARLSTSDPDRLDSYRQYGSHLGVLIQILDDLEDWQCWDEKHIDEKAGLYRSLPVVYALAVLPEQDRQKILEIISTQKKGEADTLHKLIETSGAPLYMIMEIERHCDLAIQGLDQASPQKTAGAKLTAFVEQLAHRTKL